MTLNRFYVLHCVAIPLAVVAPDHDPLLAGPEGRRDQRPDVSGSRSVDWRVRPPAARAARGREVNAFVPLAIQGTLVCRYPCIKI